MNDYDYSMLSPDMVSYFDKMRQDYGDEAFYGSQAIKNNIRQKQGWTQGVDVLAQETAGEGLSSGGSGLMTPQAAPMMTTQAAPMMTTQSNQPPLMELEGRDDEWNKNKDYMLRMQAEGQTTPEMDQWLERYQQAGGELLPPSEILEAPMAPEVNDDPWGLKEYYANQPEGQFAIDQRNVELFNTLSPEQQELYKESGDAYDLEKMASWRQPVKTFVDERGRTIGVDENGEQFVYRTEDGKSVYQNAEDATSGLVKGESSMDDINAWWDNMHTLQQSDPEAFRQWEQDNNAMAIRYHARAANKDVNQNSGLTNEQHKQRAQQLAYEESLRLGMGEDAKEDGKMIAFDYDTFDDITNEWGKGDFWKIGTLSSLPDGLGGMWEQIKSDPVKTLGPIVAAVAVGYLAGPLAAQLGISEAAAGAILQGTSSFAQGGSVDDVLKEVGMSYGLDVGLDKLAPHLKNIDTGGLGSGTIGIDQQTDFIKSFVKSGGDPKEAIAQFAGQEVGQVLFENNDEVFNTLLDRGWSPHAMVDAMGQMAADGITGQDAVDVLLGGAEKYLDSDGNIGTIPLPDTSLADIPGSEVVGDLLEHGEQALDEVYEFIRDDLPDIQPEWIKNPEGPSPDAPQWLKDLIDDAGQYGDEVYEFIRDDVPDIQPELPDVDLPNWEGSESIDVDIPLPDMPEMPDIDLPQAPNFPVPEFELPDVNTPTIENPLPDINIDLPKIDVPSIEMPDMSISDGLAAGSSFDPNELGLFGNFRTRPIKPLPPIKPQGMMRR